MMKPEQIDSAYRKVWSTVPHAQRLSAFALEIEAEVRKQDEPLIRQMLEALDTAFHQTCSVGRPKDWEQIRNALHSARARLEGKPCA